MRDSIIRLSTHHEYCTLFHEICQIILKKGWKNERKYGKIYIVMFILHYVREKT